jgi:Gpi18-like mannosyltransferase
MEFVMVGLLVLAIIIAIDWFAAKAMYEIAVMKGHPQKKYFWWCFWMAIFGYPMVIALPDRRGAQMQSVPSGDELPEL